MTEMKKQRADPFPLINPNEYAKVIIFTGAGMSAESGVPTYRGKGGIWAKYDWESYACQRAFEKDAERVLRFHELRRQRILACKPHAGHVTLARLEKGHPGLVVVTQNVDGMHQRSGSQRVTELHGSLWRLRCPNHGKFEDIGPTYQSLHCRRCREWLRPDITWFEDALGTEVFNQAREQIAESDLFVSIGTSGVVWPAAGLPMLAAESGARCVWINPMSPEDPVGYDLVIEGTAANILPELFREQEG